jgi:hypothetical protein
MSEAPFEIIPAWRIARLRLALRDAMQRGRDAGDEGEELGHRALRRRFDLGRALAQAASTRPRPRATRKGRRFPLAKQIAIWRSILAVRPAGWRSGDKAPSGGIVKAHRLAVQACRELGLTPPRYRTLYVLWHHGVPAPDVAQALRDPDR